MPLRRQARISKGLQRPGDALAGRATASNAETTSRVPVSDPIVILAADIQANPLGWPQEVIDDNAELARWYNSTGDPQPDGPAPRSFVISVRSANTLGWWADGTDDTPGAEVESREGRCRATEADGSKAPSVRSAARTVLKLVDRTDTELDLTLTAQQDAFATLINEGTLNQSEVDELISATDYTGSRAEELGVVNLGGFVYQGHIVAAKNLNAS